MVFSEVAYFRGLAALPFACSDRRIRPLSRWILPGEGVRFWDFWNVTLSKFQCFPILAILCWRWGKSNSVHTISLFLLCETCSCKRNLCVRFYFHWFYKAFSPYWSSTEMVWHCFLSSNLHVFAGRFAHGVVLLKSSKIVSFSHCDSAFSRKRR